MSERTLADLLDELSQAAESSATDYEHGSLGEAKERDKYVRALKVDILAMFTEARAAHPAPPATAGEDAKMREIATRHAEDQARPSWATHPECAHCREAIRDRGILLAALQRAAGGGA